MVHLSLIASVHRLNWVEWLTCLTNHRCLIIMLMLSYGFRVSMGNLDQLLSSSIPPKSDFPPLKRVCPAAESSKKRVADEGFLAKEFWRGAFRLYLLHLHPDCNDDALSWRPRPPQAVQDLNSSSKLKPNTRCCIFQAPSVR
jgi:hypothetical protein